MRLLDKIVDRLKAAATRAKDSLGRLGAAMRGLEKIEGNPHPAVVKSLIPRSHFTKKGPGVRKSARQAFRAMTADQRATARRMGWMR